MVECTININTVFSSLSDTTRRDILRRVLQRPQSIGELAERYKQMTFAAVAKHINVLESAQLVIKKRDGRHQIINANPKAINAASNILEQYQEIWEARFNALDELLK